MIYTAFFSTLVRKYVRREKSKCTSILV